MKIKHRVAAAVLAATLTLGVAPAANAQWGDPGTAPYCSPSVGCYTDSAGRPIFAKISGLTSREESLRQQCYWRLAGSGFAIAGGIAGKNPWAIIGAVFNAAAAATGPCRDFWNSTARFRK